MVVKAVVYRAPYDVRVESVPDPMIHDDRDAIVRLTSSALCGSDLHMYRGHVPPDPGLILGHEGIGVIVAVGNDVRLRKTGERVVLPAHLYCGVCVKCAQGLTAQCLTMRPGEVGAAFGYAGKGHYPGMHAEMVRVPYADANCIPLPGEPMDSVEDDFLMLADAFVGGWHAADLANVWGTPTVAIFGAGPIGLLTLMSVKMRGAGTVFMVDGVDARLKKAREFGGIPIDFRLGDPVDAIRAYRRRQGLPPGETALDGVDAVIDAVGFEALDVKNPAVEKPDQIIWDMARLANYGGSLGAMGVYVKQDAKPAGNEGTDGSVRVPWGLLFEKGVRIGMGRTNDRQYTRHLRDLIIAGAVRPGTVVTHHMPLSDAPDGYRLFSERAEDIIKLVFNP